MAAHSGRAPNVSMAKVADRPRGRGAVLLQTLKGGDYQRVWVIHQGQHVLIHMPVTQ